MINHMVSDPVRAITQVKKNDTKKKYEATYLTDFGELVPFGSDKDAYQKRVEHIIDVLKGKRACSSLLTHSITNCISFSAKVEDYFIRKEK